MKKQDHTEKFIELRASGQPFTKIVEELGISNSTAIRWAKDHAEKISNLLVVQLDALQEQFCMSREARIRARGGVVEKLLAHLGKVEFDYLPPDSNCLWSLSPRTHQCLLADHDCLVSVLRPTNTAPVLGFHSH